MSTTYPSNLSDVEWECLQQHFPSKPPCGRPQTHSLREICNAIFYVLRTGCPWRYLPCNFPPWQTVYYHFRHWRLKGNWHQIYTALRVAERERVGKNAEPSAAIMDSQKVKTVEESANISGFDSHKHIKGRKRHILVDTLGLPLSIYVTPADVHDTRGARCLLARLAPLVPRLKKIWADGAYRGQELADWCQAEGNWDLDVVERTPGVRGFSIQPRRWVVEKSQSQYP